MWRQSGRAWLAAGLLFLSACGSGGPEQGDIGFVEGFFGGLIADEPRAALVGREVLSAGGTAADAAVAAYFTMAVTMPGSTSLGGGGVCLLHDAVQVRTEVISFLPERPAAGGRFAVPGNIRGMFLLHARYGELEWTGLLGPAEQFARQGHAVSRAFVRDFQASRTVLLADPEARGIFGAGNGTLEEGQLLRQLELGAVVSNLRTRGPGEFYDGAIARLLVDSVARAGGTLTIADLREYRPRLLEPVRIPLGNNFVFFPPTPGGLVSTRVWQAGEDDDRYDDADAAGREHLVLEAAARAYQAVARTPGDVPPAAQLMADFSPDTHRAVTPSVAVREDTQHEGASIVAVDNQGRTVACSFTMNGPFGAGVVAPGTGILLANAPDGPRAAEPSVAMVANENIGLTLFAAAGSGPVAETVARVALETVRDTDGNMVDAVAAPRVHSTGNPDVALVESALPAETLEALRGQGHELSVRPRIGRVNGFYCPRGLPRVQTCQFVKDPRSFGLAVSSDE